MANTHRGEIAAEFDGRRYTLCLTLGALAELESALQAPDLVGLAARFDGGRLSARDLIAIIGCGLRGGGHPLSDTEVAALRIPEGLPGYVRVAAALLAATFGAQDAPDAEADPHPPEPQNA